MMRIYFFIWAVAFVRTIQQAGKFLPWQQGAKPRLASEAAENILVLFLGALTAWASQLAPAPFAVYLKALGFGAFYATGYARGRSEMIYALFYGAALTVLPFFPAPASCAAALVFTGLAAAAAHWALQGVRYRLLFVSAPKLIAGLPLLLISSWLLVFVFYFPLQALLFVLVSGS